MNSYRVEYVSHCFLGSTIKLNPNGKNYKILTIGGPKGKYGKSIILQDSKGREKQVTWDRLAYIKTENIGD